MPNKPKQKKKKLQKGASNAVHNRFRDFDGKRYSPKKGAGRKRDADISGS